MIIYLPYATAQNILISEERSEVVKYKNVNREIDNKNKGSDMPVPIILDVGPGAGDIRFSEMGGSGIANFSQALESNIAYNTITGFCLP